MKHLNQFKTFLSLNLGRISRIYSFLSPRYLNHSLASLVPYTCCKEMERSSTSLCDHTNENSSSIHQEGCTDRLLYLVLHKWLKLHFLWLMVSLWATVRFDYTPIFIILDSASITIPGSISTPGIC